MRTASIRRTARLSLRLLTVTSLVGASAVLAFVACGGDDGTTATPDADASTADSGSADATVDSSSDGAADAGADVTANVDASACSLGDGGAGTKCGSSCVDLTSDPEHCGTCQKACEPGSICQGQCTDIIGSLNGLRWELPCTSAVSGDGYSCASPDTFNTSTTVKGAAGRSYDVRLHFRGVVEQRTYVGATAGGASAGQADGGVNPEFFASGGTYDLGDPYNVYTLEVDAPDGGTSDAGDAGPQTFRLNAGTSDIHRCFPIDYFATVRVETGSTLVLSADAIEGHIISNTDGTGQAIVVPGVPPAPQAFNGQFVQVDVDSVTLVP